MRRRASVGSRGAVVGPPVVGPPVAGSLPVDRFRVLDFDFGAGVTASSPGSA
jgi:hypothetical protein